MLVRLSGNNFRSFKGQFELSMVAAELTREEDCHRGVIEVPVSGSGKPLRLLRTIAIYGANASGKTSLLTAAAALRWLGTDSSERSIPGKKIPTYEPFLLHEETRTSPIQLGCDVVCDNSLLTYEITYNEQAILNESLTVYNEKGEIKLIDRRPSGEVLGKLFTRSKANQLYVKDMRPDVSVLSKLAQHGSHKGPQSVRPYYKAIRNATHFADYSHVTGTIISSTDPYEERFADDADYREWIMRHLIRTADIGICDVQTSRENIDLPSIFVELAKTDSRFKMPDKTVVVSFVHEGKSKQALNFSLESSGTRKLFNIASDWWRLANDSVTLLVDELSASLHPRLLDRLVRAINEAPKERVQSQLIFTTHDTGLLESQNALPAALRRDQVYFTKKDNEGASELYSLTEFKEDARPVHNIRKRYLSGLYGAIPSVEKFSL